MRKEIGWRPRTPDDTFSHFLVTRFNIGLKKMDRLNKNGVKLSDKAEEWMTHRLKLFNQICAPSIRAQTCPHFTWIIICDRATSSDILLDIEGEADNIRIVYSFDGMKELIQRASLNVKQVITTCCDNDDALNVGFIERVQEIVPLSEKAIVSFPRFEVWDMDKGTMANVVGISNMFISMVEPAGVSPDTVYVNTHGKMIDLYPYVKIDTPQPMALAVVHEYNIYNTCYGKLKQDPDWSQYGGVKL